MTDADPQREPPNVRVFAAALDAGDFAAAGAALAAGCEYHEARITLAGRAAVQRHLAERRARLTAASDDLRCASAWDGTGAAAARLRCTEYLVHAGGDFHRHEFTLELELDAGGVIRRIVRHEDPAAAAALQAFLSRATGGPASGGE